MIRLSHARGFVKFDTPDAPSTDNLCYPAKGENGKRGYNGRMPKPTSICALLVLLTLAPPAAGAGGAPTLTYLETQGSSRFDWVTYQPASTQRRVIASFAGDGRRARLAWSRDGKRALVTEGLPYGEDNLIMTEGRRAARLRIWEVTLASRRKQAYEFVEPPRTIVQDVAFDAEGRITAIALQEAPSLTATSGTFIRFEGRRYDVEPGAEGQPALAHAYRMTAPSRWSRIETVATTVNTHFAAGTRALSAEKRLTPRSFAIAGSAPDGVAVTEPALLQALGRLYPERNSGRNGGWAAIKTGGGPVLIWHAWHEYLVPTGVVAFPTRSGLTPAPQAGFRYVAPPKGYDPWACPHIRGHYLLVSTWRMGEHPRLYDVKSRRLIHASDRASAAVFWP